MKEKIISILMIIVGFFSLSILVINELPRLQDYSKARKLYTKIEKEYTEPSKRKGTETPLNDNDSSGDLDSDFDCIEVDSTKLLLKNTDYIGWIYVPKTKISYPVVKSVDNRDYLHSNFYGQYSFPGTIFLDARCNGDIMKDHTILYGHNMTDGSMFADLKKFYNSEFTKEHPVFWFITPEQNLLYKIFSVCQSDPSDEVQFGVSYADEMHFIKDMEALKNRSLIKIDIDVEKGDRVMTLSTCNNDRVSRCTVNGILIGSF